jgi:hypothetical protein
MKPGAFMKKDVDLCRARRDGTPLPDALAVAEVPRFVRAFVQHTIGTCAHGSTLEVMARSFYGRENVIPNMFPGLPDQWGLSGMGRPPYFVSVMPREAKLP